jgi:two-component system sensor histidine kinase EvgS
MQGSIGLESEPGRGSLFSVELREVRVAAGRSNAPERSADPVAPQFSPARVLVADDQHLSRELLREFLEPRGLSVISATNGQEAVDLARRERPDLILMDIKMPIMDGRAAARLLRDDPLTAAIPIVAVTAQALHDPEAPAESVFVERLIKPVNSAEFMRLLSRLLPLAEGRAEA